MNDVEMIKLLDSVYKEVYQEIDKVIEEVIATNGVTPEEFTEKKVLLTIAITAALQRHFNAGLKVLGVLGLNAFVAESTIKLCSLMVKEVSMRALTNVSVAEKFEQN